MFSLGSSQQYYLYAQPCDMRKSFDGLSGLVLNCMKRNPTSGEVFVFLNRRNTHIKLLHWQKDGFVLYYKRLESGSFLRPKNPHAQIGWTELMLMIEGIQILKSRTRKRFKKH